MNENETPRSFAVGTDYAVADLSPADLIDADLYQIETIVKGWNGVDIRPHVPMRMLRFVGDILARAEFGFDDFVDGQEPVAPDWMIEIALADMARRADDFDMIVALSKYLSADEGQRLYNVIITLTRMQRHRTNLRNGVAAV
jgi:hypothetical protein